MTKCSTFGCKNSIFSVVDNTPLCEECTRKSIKFFSNVLEKKDAYGIDKEGVACISSSVNEQIRDIESISQN